MCVERLKKVMEQQTAGGLRRTNAISASKAMDQRCTMKIKVTVYTVIDRMMALIALQTFVLVIWDV